jgi:hypothetical protein
MAGTDTHDSAVANAREHPLMACETALAALGNPGAQSNPAR